MLPVGSEGDAHAGVTGDLFSVEIEGFGEALDDPLGNVGGFRRPGQVLEEDRELIASQAGDAVGGPAAGAQALAYRDQQEVARTVAETVVDGLEIVEVEEQHRHHPTGATAPLHGVLHSLGEQHPVGQLGQGIVEGLVPEFLLELG